MDEMNTIYFFINQIAITAFVNDFADGKEALDNFEIQYLMQRSTEIIEQITSLEELNRTFIDVQRYTELYQKLEMDFSEFSAFCGEVGYYKKDSDYLEKNQSKYDLVSNNFNVIVTLIGKINDLIDQRIKSVKGEKQL